MSHKKTNDLDTVCVVCGTPFHRRRGPQVTCSKQCSEARHRNKENARMKALYHRQHPDATYRSPWSHGKGNRAEYHLTHTKPEGAVCIYNSCVKCVVGDCMTCAFNPDITLQRQIRRLDAERR